MSDTFVVVPARDEADRIAQCLASLAAQTVGRDRFTIVVVLDACRDDTGAVATRVAADLGLSLQLIDGPGLGSGPARRIGMDLAARQLLCTGHGDGLVATTDADSCPAADWLAAQQAHLAAGAEVVAGRIELDASEARLLPPAALTDRAQRARERLREVRREETDAAHHHFAGASIGVTASVYARVGGIPPLPDLEDEGFARRLRAHRVAILRPDDVLVVTSARTDGRATRGLSVDLARSARAGRGDVAPVALPALARP